MRYTQTPHFVAVRCAHYMYSPSITSNVCCLPALLIIRGRKRGDHAHCPRNLDRQAERSTALASSVLWAEDVGSFCLHCAREREQSWYRLSRVRTYLEAQALLDDDSWARHHRKRSPWSDGHRSRRMQSQSLPHCVILNRRKI